MIDYFRSIELLLRESVNLESPNSNRLFSLAEDHLLIPIEDSLVMSKRKSHEHENDEITEAIIGYAYMVANTLGHGFLEKVYENALAYELQTGGFCVSQQHPAMVRYKNIVVGDYVADLVVEDSVIVELKAVKALDDWHLAQCLNYLRATELKTCLLLNFGRPRIEVKRISL